MKKNIIFIGLIIGLFAALVWQKIEIEHLKQYKEIVQEINGQSYFTDNITLEENTFYKINFNYELGKNGWWELYID